MIFCLCFPLCQELFPQPGQNGMILAVNRRHAAKLSQPFQNADGLLVRLPVIIGQVHLEAGKALIHHGSGLFQDLLIQILIDPVESVICHTFSICILLVYLKLMVKIAAFWSEAHMIDDRRCAAKYR